MSELRETISIQKNTGTDAGGFEVTTWTEQFSARAAVKVLSAGEGGGDKDSAINQVLFKIRFNAAQPVLPGWRVVHRTLAYEIVGDPINLGFRDWELHITGKLVK